MRVFIYNNIENKGLTPICTDSGDSKDDTWLWDTPLDGVVEEIAQRGGGREGPCSGPAWDVEGGSGMDAGRVGAGGVMGAKGVTDNAAACVLFDVQTLF